MRSQRRLRALGLLAAVLVLAFLLGREAVEHRRKAEGASADAPSARESSSENASVRAAARETAKSAADSTRPAGDSAESESVGGAAVGFESERSTHDEPAEGLRHGAAVEAIVLDPIDDNRGLAPIHLAGRDPLAPRELLAWRIKHGRFAVVARGSSDPDGSLDFPEVVAPMNGMEVVVTAADSLPGLPGESEPRRLAPRNPQSPTANLLASDAGGARVRIFPGEATGDVVLADSYGVVLARYPVSKSPLAAHRAIDVSFATSGPNTVVLLAHELADGRASDWAVLELPAPVADEGSSD